MPKKKKTRKQKILADTRHHSEKAPAASQQMPLYSVDPFTQKETSVSQKVTPIHSSVHIISSEEYAYLTKDLFKTLAVTSTIIIAEIVLHIFTKGV